MRTPVNPAGEKRMKVCTRKDARRVRVAITLAYRFARPHAGDFFTAKNVHQADMMYALRAGFRAANRLHLSGESMAKLGV